MAGVVALPEDLRGELRDPIGPVFTDAEDLLASVEGALITVGDVVTAHVEGASRTPDVSLIDERTEREPVAPEYEVGGADVTVSNPAATLTAELLRAIREAVRAETPTRIMVDGEEDLATVPAIIAAPDGTSVVYGQPGEGMVLVVVTPEVKARMRSLVRRMDGDPDRALSLLE